MRFALSLTLLESPVQAMKHREGKIDSLKVGFSDNFTFHEPVLCTKMCANRMTIISCELKPASQNASQACTFGATLVLL